MALGAGQPLRNLGRTLGVVEGEQALAMGYRSEEFRRRHPDAPAGRVGRDQLGMSLFQRQQLPTQIVVVGIGKLWIGKHVVAVIVVANVRDQVRDQDGRIPLVHAARG